MSNVAGLSVFSVGSGKDTFGPMLILNRTEQIPWRKSKKGFSNGFIHFYGTDRHLRHENFRKTSTYLPNLISNGPVKLIDRVIGRTCVELSKLHDESDFAVTYSMTDPCIRPVFND